MSHMRNFWTLNEWTRVLWKLWLPVDAKDAWLCFMVIWDVCTSNGWDSSSEPQGSSSEEHEQPNKMSWQVCLLFRKLQGSSKLWMFKFSHILWGMITSKPEKGTFSSQMGDWFKNIQIFLDTFRHLFTSLLVANQTGYCGWMFSLSCKCLPRE